MVYWNTWYRAEPAKQLEHIERLDEQLRNYGAQVVVLCLSEVTATGRAKKPGLFEHLQEADFNPFYTTVSHIKKRPKVHEGLVVASRDTNFASAAMLYDIDVPLREQRAIKNMKLRQATRVHLPDVDIIGAHLSYPKPDEEEIRGILDLVHHTPCHESAKTHAKVVGGDFNTVVSKEIVDRFETEGLVKLRDPEHTVTCALRPGSKYGFELDHVFVTENIATQAQLVVGDQGPSNHNPLLVTIRS